MSTERPQKEKPPIRRVPALTVDCPECGYRAGSIINGELVYTVDHHGTKHTIRIDVERLRRLLAA